jgi:hypothetical protein
MNLNTTAWRLRCLGEAIPPQRLVSILCYKGGGKREPGSVLLLHTHSNDHSPNFYKKTAKIYSANLQKVLKMSCYV